MTVVTIGCSDRLIKRSMLRANCYVYVIATCEDELLF